MSPIICHLAELNFINNYNNTCNTKNYDKTNVICDNLVKSFNIELMCHHVNDEC